MRTLILMVLLTITAKATDARDVLIWDARAKWEALVDTSAIWAKQFDPYNVSIHNRELLKKMDSQYKAWRAVMKQLGDL